LLVHTLGGLVGIEWSLDRNVCPVFADQAQLELALVNLIINARDAMPQGGTIIISAHNAEVGDDDLGIAPGQYVRLGIRDQGTGIAPDNLDRVMEPFFTTKDIGKGSGLGLSMVYGFAKQSNGLFRIESKLGDGTLAELWLPRGPEAEQLIDNGAARPRRAKAMRKLTIMLVDDHPEVRSTTAAVIADLGHRVMEAANGHEALKALSEADCQCDLLITDYAMPNLSGTEFLRKARKLCPNVPALIITGYAEPGAISDPPEGVEILLKPFTPTALEAAMVRITQVEATAT